MEMVRAAVEALLYVPATTGSAFISMLITHLGCDGCRLCYSDCIQDFRVKDLEAIEERNLKEGKARHFESPCLSFKATRNKGYLSLVFVPTFIFQGKNSN